MTLTRVGVDQSKIVTPGGAFRPEFYVGAAVRRLLAVACDNCRNQMAAPIRARLTTGGGERAAKTSEKMNRIGSFHVDIGTIGSLCRAVIVAVVCMVVLSGARAEVRVSGAKNAVIVHAKNASIDDVIAAVNASLHVEVSMAPASAIPVTGTYTGSIRRVFARMLAGHDFILEFTGDKMTITLANQAVPPRRPRPLCVQMSRPRKRQTPPACRVGTAGSAPTAVCPAREVKIGSDSLFLNAAGAKKLLLTLLPVMTVTRKAGIIYRCIIAPCLRAIGQCQRPT